MENVMTGSTHRPLNFGQALARQFGLLWQSRRPLLLGVALLAVLVLAGEPWSDAVTARLLTPWPVWVALAGPFWAFAVFHNEGPSARLYHWSMPVDRTRHTLARLGAGILWLWILLVVLVTAGATMAVLDGDAAQLGAVGLVGWVNLFTGPLLGYLGISVLTVASDYPIRWFFGLLFGVPFVVSLLDNWMGLERLADAVLEPLLIDEWGLFTAMVGGLGEAVVQLDARLTGHTGANPAFDLSYWWPATAGWIVALAVVVAFVASRHPDTLPRLRRKG